MSNPNQRHLYLIAFAHFCDDINMGSLPALLPFLVLWHNFDYTEVAALMFVSSCFSSIVQPLVGYYADRGSRQWLMQLGILGAGIPFAVVGFLDNYMAILIAVSLMGIGNAIFHPEAARMVNKLSAGAKGMSMSIFSTGGIAGFVLGPLLLLLVVETLGPKGLAIYGIMAVITSCYLQTQLKAINTAIAAQTLETAAQTKESKVTGNDWHGFSLLTATLIFRSTVQSAMTTFLPLFCIGVIGASTTEGNLTLSIMAICGILGTLAGGKLSDRIGYVRTMRIGTLLLIPVVASIIFPHNLYVIYGMLICYSLAMQGTYSSFVVLGQSYLAKSVGLASGVTLGISFSAGGVVLPLLGYIADAQGLNFVMWVIFGVTVGCALIAMTLRKPNNNSLPDEP